uniref:Uncharacterized protein n=1 Tax=Anguilla anguilla TaxID=7936 RepID=A0A0E9VUE2_ANGAN
MLEGARSPATRSSFEVQLCNAV